MRWFPGRNCWRWWSRYPRSGGRGRPPVGLAAMLRIYFLQQWFALSDRQTEDALYDIESLRRFAGFSNVAAALPDEMTILNFRHLLERHDLPPRLLAAVNGLLQAKGLLVSHGTMVDATIIHAPSHADRDRVALQGAGEVVAGELAAPGFRRGRL